jgi:MoaA/NifB/PqqE/SkfB family radical SAM enzyme
MCDIWKGNANPRQLTEDDVQSLLVSLKSLRTQWVVMSGGEAFMNPNLFRLCDILRDAGMKITILSTGMLLTRYAEQVVSGTDEVIVSLDGPEKVHNAIRRIPNAYQKLAEGVRAVKALKPDFRITARCVIQRLNFAEWPAIIETAQALNLDQISFLPADVSSEAFNRPDPWDTERIEDVRLHEAELPQLETIINTLVTTFQADFSSGFIAESPAKIQRIYDYYAAFYGLTEFPVVRCNAPWVSTVVEADGTVRPCFFHSALGNMRETPLLDLLNARDSVAFRRQLDMDRDPICQRCVCTLNLRPMAALGS